VFGRLTGSKNLYDFKWPWSSKPSIEKLEARLEPLLQKDRSLDYATLPTSTTIVARKVPG